MKLPAAALTPPNRPQRPSAETRPRRCMHCRDWITAERLTRLPDTTECRECADELRRGVIRP